MLSQTDLQTIRDVIRAVLENTNASGAACDIVDDVLAMVVNNHKHTERFIDDKNAAGAHMYRAMRLASEDMARLVGPCTGVPPTLGKVLEDPGKARDAAIARYAWTAAEAREAASTWYADWLERAEEEATPDA
jgi:hypothetical protein